MGVGFFPKIDKHCNNKWIPSAVHATAEMIDKYRSAKILDTLSQARKDDWEDAEGKLKGPCYFGHKETSAVRDGKHMWYRNPVPSFWPGKAASGITLCFK